MDFIPQAVDNTKVKEGIHNVYQTHRVNVDVDDTLKMQWNHKSKAIVFFIITRDDSQILIFFSNCSIASKIIPYYFQDKV